MVWRAGPLLDLDARVLGSKLSRHNSLGRNIDESSGGAEFGAAIAEALTINKSITVIK